MRSKSIHGASVSEIKANLENSTADGFEPTAAIVFISIEQDRKAVCNLLKDRNISVFGATSCGEFIDGKQTKGETAILLLELRQKHFSILLEALGEGTLEQGASRLANRVKKEFSNPSIILCPTGIDKNGAFFNGDELVTHLEKKLGPDKLFFGGMAGDDWKLNGTYVFTEKEETDRGIVALVLNGDAIEIKGMAITGWKPMGISRTVTKSKGNLLHEIDGIPAVEMYLKYLGRTDLEDKIGYDVLKELSFEYPFIVERENNETILKSPMKINQDENALFMDIEMPVGTKFWFTKPPELDIVEEVLDKVNLLKGNPDEQADALLVFSCAGRQPVLGPLVNEENDGLAKVWKTPMAGFFTYGEIGRSYNGKQNFHSGACCWVAIKERI
ncbi:FIST signal transduction protein [Altibacter lentus]|uniref:FIST signal transduction protein n=1 Tax=Altibacter lentus TaxID=1223410 RepID=UPI00055979DC|nr:FIST N-terminal domain-containing protein [Altibacter lentus]